MKTNTDKGSISMKQYNLLLVLHKNAGREYDADALLELSSENASDLINRLRSELQGDGEKINNSNNHHE